MAGKNYLRVSGILMVLLGIAGVVVYGLLDMILGRAVAVDASAEGHELMIIGSCYLLWSVFELVAGFYGIKNCGSKAKAGICHVMGLLILLVTMLAFAVQNTILPNVESIARGCITLFASCLIPVCYVYGSFLNSKDNG